VVASNTQKNNTPLRYATVAAKVILGVGFLVFGANGFLHFITIPLPAGQSAQSFLGALDSTGYLKVVKALEMLAGALLIGGRLAPLALLILGPIVINILLYDLFMDPKGVPIAGFFSVLILFLAYRHKEHFAPFFVVRPEHCTFKGN
jgi:putative oxidoreductase